MEAKLKLARISMADMRGDVLGVTELRLLVIIIVLNNFYEINERYAENWVY